MSGKLKLRFDNMSLECDAPDLGDVEVGDVVTARTRMGMSILVVITEINDDGAKAVPYVEGCE